MASYFSEREFDLSDHEHTDHANETKNGIKNQITTTLTKSKIYIRMKADIFS